MGTGRCPSTASDCIRLWGLPARGFGLRVIGGDESVGELGGEKDRKDSLLRCRDEFFRSGLRRIWLGMEKPAESLSSSCGDGTPFTNQSSG